MKNPAALAGLRSARPPPGGAFMGFMPQLSEVLKASGRADQAAMRNIQDLNTVGSSLVAVGGVLSGAGVAGMRLGLLASTAAVASGHVAGYGAAAYTAATQPGVANAAGIAGREIVRVGLNGGMGAAFGEWGGIGAERGALVGLGGLYGARLAGGLFATEGAGLAMGMLAEGGGAALGAFFADYGFQETEVALGLRTEAALGESLNAATFAAIGAGLGRIGAASGQIWRWSADITQPFPTGAPSFGNILFGEFGGGVFGGLGGLLWEDMYKRPVR